jgi:hypothetical protein
VTSNATILGDANDDTFYDAIPIEPNQLYQGEILADIPLLRMPKPSRWQLLRSRSGRRLDDALEHGNIGGQVRVLDSNQSKEEWQSDRQGDFAMAVLDKTPVLVLNQTCDVQNNDFLQVAPIFSVVAEQRDVEKLKRGELFSAFWLAKHVPEIPEDSYADLELIQAIHKSYVKRIRPDQHFRLAAARTRDLQRTITRYFGRPNSFDSRHDSVPITGTYLCVRCFYMDGIVTAVALDAKSQFPACKACNATSSAWVIKGS